MTGNYIVSDNDIVSVIKRETAACSENIAVVSGDLQVTYRRLLAAADRIADHLRALGAKERDRVALCCEDSVDYIALALAVLGMGAVIVPVSDSLSDDEVADALERVDTHWFIYDVRLHPSRGGDPVPPEMLYGRECRVESRVVNGAGVPDAYDRMDPAFIRFSSGTTGTSKGVLLTHAAIVDRTAAADKVLAMTPDDTVAWVLSMSYHFVVSILLFLRRGARIVLCTGSFPKSLLETFENRTCSLIYASPFHYRVMTYSDAFKPNWFENVRLAISTAVNLPGKLAADFAGKFGTELAQAYGLIEVGLPFINASGDPSRRGSVGQLLPDYQAKILDPDDKGVGKVALKGKGLFDAYYAPWRERTEVAQDGWFVSGDLGYLTEDGYLFLVGRQNDVINAAGMKVFPYEVEAVLNRFPNIKESLVYSIPHDDYGELPGARIVLQHPEHGISMNDLRRFCYEHLATFEVPKTFEIVGALEKTASGKLRRNAT